MHVSNTSLQNHTPEVMVIDEIGRREEVAAAGTSKARGVRLIASAHGTLRSLYENKELKGLLGDFMKVTAVFNASAQSKCSRNECFTAQAMCSCWHAR